MLSERLQSALQWSMNPFKLVSESTWETIRTQLPTDMSDSDRKKLKGMCPGSTDEPLLLFVMGLECMKHEGGRDVRSIMAGNRYYDVNELYEGFPECIAFILLLGECHFLLEDSNGSKRYLQKAQALLRIEGIEDAFLEEAIAHVGELAHLEANDDEDDDEDWIIKRYSRPNQWEPSTTPFNIFELQKKWVDLQEQGDGAIQFARYASVETNQVEGVFMLEFESSKKLAHCGLFVNSIEGISRNSRIKNEEKVLSIIRNTQHCYSQLKDVIDGNTAFDKDFLCALQRKLLDRDNIEINYDLYEKCHRATIVPMGRYREVPCFADNENYTIYFCPPAQIEEEMEYFWEQVSQIINSEDIDPYRACATLQWIFLRVHPFADGNGRIGRIVSSIPLLKAGLPPVVVSLHSKKRYLKCLETADDDGDIDDLARFIQNESFRAIEGLLQYKPSKSPPKIRLQKKSWRDVLQATE